MVLGEHFAHPWFQMAGGHLQRYQVGQQIRTQHSGQLSRRTPAAEDLHRGPQHPISQDGRGGIGCW
jgi:hypothetical protein